MVNIIIGTSGHVDHGKTSLIKALTGVDTDKLKEEKERGITIQLGFTYFQLNEETRAGIVDVPGHEKFVRNMLAGVGGMDLVLMVVAADEGVMPQTKEHLNILQLLNVKKGIVVVTKKDIVDDELLELVVEDIKDAIKGTFLEKSPFIPVSSVTNEGIEELKAEINKYISNAQIQSKSAKDFFRLPIDRVFSLKGIGTVVTGTLKDGTISVGDTCVVYPGERQVRVRQIQVHGEQVDTAFPGQRSAVNLTGIEKEELSMGDLLTTFAYLKPQNKVNCILRILDHAPELDSGTIVRFHWGTEETYGRAVLLDRDTLLPGESCYCQLRLEKEVVVARGDSFVIRSMSPVDTIGGGTVFNSTSKRIPRYNMRVIKNMEINEIGETQEIILEGIKQYGIRGITFGELAQDLQINRREIEEVIPKLKIEDKIVDIKDDNIVLMEKSHYNNLTSKILAILSEYHVKYPLRIGMDKEELRSKLGSKYSVKLMVSILKKMQLENLVEMEGLYVSLKGFQISLSGKELALVNQALSLLKESQFKPPNREDINIPVNLLEYLVRKGDVLIIGDIPFHKDVVNEGISEVIAYLKENPQGMELSQIKDLLGTSRKYIVPILEYYDGLGITKRSGDVRILGVKGRELSK
ncbi:selenocysteine-specific translation elongation factor [Alkalicella caledoniensis]|uniref:Selenocysteine-specific elongation factor n=1 Tax=Alkalicella caledoniensis TaxID=2731377 RepID=A0A7G9W953_ALKCA|nr:selenocysteine-specific translation elongation factor [Alkalicella caledoniensis]QNO15215.1 selenocysteine-specific translation elongation factor [Alkalicella caledoniensis]